MTEFHCTDCGKCCLEGASRLQATAADLALWEAEAPHVLDWVQVREEAGGRVGDLWVSPRTGRDTVRCPWLRKRRLKDSYYCRIYAVRPTVCRRYPVSREHAEFTGCPGYD